MRLLKGLLGLTAFLFLLTTGYWVSQHYQRKTPFEKVIPQIDAWKIQQGSDSLLFARRASDWSVTAGTGVFTADADRVKRALDNLQSLRIDDEISDRSDRASDFDVDDARGLFVDLMKGTTVLARVIVGKQAVDYQHLYVRYPEKPNVYLTSGLTRVNVWPVAIKNWRSKALWSFSSDAVVSILVETPGSRAYLLRSSSTWTCNGQEALAESAGALVNALATLEVDEFVEPPIPADLAPEKMTFARVVVQTTSASYELKFGKRDTKLQRSPAMLAHSPYVIWLYDVHVNALLKSPADFLPQPSKK